MSYVGHAVILLLNYIRVTVCVCVGGGGGGGMVIDGWGRAY